MRKMGTFYLILTPWTRLHLHQILHTSSLLKIERDEEMKTVAASERQLQAEKKKHLNDHRRDLGPEPTPPSGPQHLQWWALQPHFDPGPDQKSWFSSCNSKPW